MRLLRHGEQTKALRAVQPHPSFPSQLLPWSLHPGCTVYCGVFSSTPGPHPPKAGSPSPQVTAKSADMANGNRAALPRADALSPVRESPSLSSRARC